MSEFTTKVVERMTKVTIEYKGRKAVTDGVAWTSDDKVLERMLNTLYGPKDVPMGYVPDMAEAMASLIERDGAAIKKVEGRPKYDPKKIY